MYLWIQAFLLLFNFLSRDIVGATRLTHREYQRFVEDTVKVEQRVVEARGAADFYLNIVKGIFRSDKGNLIQNLGNIPCSAIQSLESDVDEAEDFVNSLEAGEVPSILSDLPGEAISEFADIVDLATQVVDVAEAAITDVVDAFNDIEDGDIGGVASKIESDITAGWDDLTSGVKSIWSGFTCWIEGCTSTSVGFCDLPGTTAAVTAPYATAAQTTSANGAAASSSAASAQSAAAASSTAASATSAAAASEKSAIQSTTQSPSQTPEQTHRSEIIYTIYEQWFHSHNVDLDFGNFVAKLISIRIPSPSETQATTIEDIIDIHRAWCGHVEHTLPLCSKKGTEIEDHSYNDEHGPIGINQRQNEYFKLRPLFRALIVIVDHQTSQKCAQRVVDLLRTKLPSSGLSTPISFQSIEPKLDQEMFPGYKNDNDNLITTTLSSAIDFIMALESRESKCFSRKSPRSDHSR